MNAETGTATASPAPVPARRGMGNRLLIALLLIAFIAGGALAIWGSANWDRLRAGRVQESGQADPAGDNAGDAAMGNIAGVLDPAGLAVADMQQQVSADDSFDSQVARVTALEQRLARISLAAQAASYNANRAESIMTAFAARRALDAGRPLGYVEASLRARFGDAQPKAVATIVNAAAEPVTLADLRLGLDDIGFISAQGAQDDWWAGLMRELRGLAVLRSASRPSDEAEQRLIRARRAVETGQVDLALQEMEALPRQPAVVDWLERARRWNEAHRALDVIEAAAILEPRTATSIESRADSASGAALDPPAADGRSPRPRN